MSNFHNVSFPLDIAGGASGGPQRETQITSLASGTEHRNTRRANSLRRYNVGAGIRSAQDIQTLIAFFEARRGQLYAFRFRDPLDFRASGQIIGTGDGIQTEFQLTKTYGDSAGSWTRVISKPRTVTAAVDGQAASVSFDDLTGLITFENPPASGALIMASFDFDVPVRFDQAHLDLSPRAYGAGKAAILPLVEVAHA